MEIMDFDTDLYYYDEKAGDRIVNLAERYCRHTEDSISSEMGDLFILEDWQKKIFREIFGIKKKKTKKRKHRYVWLEVPKKNGKSPMGSIVAIYLTGFDGAKGAEVFSCAGDKDQARIIFDTTKKMIEADQVLNKEFKTYRNSVMHLASGSVFRVLSAEADTKHGPRIHGITFDEFHVQPHSKLYDTFQGYCQ